MTAKYFYERLLGYDDECRKTGKYYYGFNNGMVDIHHKNDESVWFTIYEDGSAVQESVHGGLIKLNIDDLEGDDFELFNSVQIIKSGYLVLDTDSLYKVKNIISKLHHHIGSFEDEERMGFRNDSDEKIPYLCGGSCWNNGVTDSFSYYATTGVQLDIQTVNVLCKENMNRKHYGLRCIPFIKSMDNKSSIYISFIHNISNNNDDISDKCNKALSELLSYMKELEIECKWVNCKITSPCYC